MLRDLKTGATVQMLDLKELSVSQAEVVQVTPPIPQMNIQVTQNGVMPPRQLMSLRVRWNGKEALLNNVYADVSSSESSDGSGLVVCENEAALLNELRTGKSNFKSLLDNQGYFERGMAWCEEQIAMRDPVKKAELQSQRQVEEIRRQFEGIVSEQNAKIDGLTETLKSLVQALGTKKGKE